MVFGKKRARAFNGSRFFLLKLTVSKGLTIDKLANLRAKIKLSLTMSGKVVRAAEQETSDCKGMYGEYKGAERNDEADEIRSATGVWRLGEDDKRVVCADNPNVEIYEKQRDNGRLPQENETDTTNGLRL